MSSEYHRTPSQQAIHGFAMGHVLLADQGFPDEEWSIIQGAEHIKAAVEALLGPMLQASLYTIKPQYLFDLRLVSHRVTLVKLKRVDAGGGGAGGGARDDGPTGTLLAFAFINLEAVEMLDVTAWSGTERLSVWATSLKSAGIRKAARNKAKILQHVGHLGAIACSPLARKGLGSRLLHFQKCVAHQLLSGPRPFDGALLLGLEAIRPLDLLYYGRHGFETTTPAFWTTSDPVSLQPMMCKLGPEHALASLSVLGYVSPTKLVNGSVVSKEHAWTMRHLTTLTDLVSQFLWRTPNHDEAAESLKLIVAKVRLTLVEALKLWSMRYHSLRYASGHFDSFGPSESREPCPAHDDWFKPFLKDSVIELMRRWA